MDKLYPVRCNYCKKIYYRSKRRINEAKKYRWKMFCSSKCLSLSRFKQVLFICSNSECNKSFYRSLSQSKKSNNHFCSGYCAAKVNNLDKRKIRICANRKCLKTFYGKRKYCSYKCIPKVLSKYTKEKVILLIQKFVRREKRIPVKREINYLYRPARTFFDTWNNAIKSAGFDCNPVLFAKKYIAKDGHKCDSMAERIIDDWLSRRKIPHKRNVKYPGNYGFSVDFKIGNWWIEFFGLEGELKKYDQLKARKLGLIKKEKLKLIDIHPKDLFPKGRIENKLGFLVS